MATLIFRRVKMVDIRGKVLESWLFYTSICMIDTRLIKTAIISLIYHMPRYFFKNFTKDCSEQSKLRSVSMNNNVNIVSCKTNTFSKIFIQNLFQFLRQLLPYSTIKKRELIIAEDNILKVVRLCILLARNLGNFRCTSINMCILNITKY